LRRIRNLRQRLVGHGQSHPVLAPLGEQLGGHRGGKAGVLVEVEVQPRRVGQRRPPGEDPIGERGEEQRSHPTFFPLLEQWEQHAQAIQRLRVGEAFIRLPNDSVRRIKTPSLPAIAVFPEQVAAVQEYYLQQYFRPVSQPVPATRTAVTAVPEASTPAPPPIRRHHPDERPEAASEPAATPDGEGPGTVFALGGDRGTG
jgi:hypothetical protein